MHNRTNSADELWNIVHLFDHDYHLAERLALAGGLQRCGYHHALV